MKISIITVTYNRSQLLKNRALKSLLNQSDRDFEWILVNDGANSETKQIMDNTDFNIPIVYLEIEHDGFGLCKGRNLALEYATGNWICYLDDDNLLYPNFISEVESYYTQNPNLNYFLPIQNRRRNIIKDGKTIKTGKSFLSPSQNSKVQDFINPINTLFDSNGFAHQRVGSPIWNEDLRIYCDYEFFLRCTSIWGEESFGICPEVLIEYVQTNEGEVGKSNYQTWARELGYIFDHLDTYKVLQRYNAEKWLPQIIHKYQQYAEMRKDPRAFTVK